jgi:signal transduction histidine kinase
MVDTELVTSDGSTHEGATTVERDAAEGRRPVWQHAFFYSWLLLATVGPLSDRVRSGQLPALPLALILALAAWYAWWHLRRESGIRRSPWIYLAGAGLLWLALLAVDDSFLLVGLNVFAPYCLHTLRVGLTVVALCTGGWLWLRVAATGSVSWMEIVIAALFAVSGSTAVGYISSLARTSAERKRLIDQLEAAQAGRAAAERQAGIAAERQRLARDIHDTLTQGFASIVMLLEAAEALLPGDSPARRHVAQAVRTARESLGESRRVVWALRPGRLGDGDLADALDRLAVQLSEETGAGAEAVVTGTPRPVSAETQTALLRVTQEALSNIRRHAGARHVSLTLSYMDDVVALDVQDDGDGFDAGRIAELDEQLAGVGLKTMRERVAELGGTLVIESSPGEGTTVAATLPVQGTRDRASDAALPSQNGSPITAGER